MGGKNQDAESAVSKLKDLLLGETTNTMPFAVRFKILISAIVPITSIIVVAGLLSTAVNESSPNKGEHGLQLPRLLVNGSGSSMMANTYWRSMAVFSSYLQLQQSPFELDASFLAAGSGAGRSDFFNAFGLFGATDSDVSASDLKFFLPDTNNEGSDSGYSSATNVTTFVDSRAPAHLGIMLLPTVAGALAIVHNLPGLPDGSQLALNATVLGDIFCGAIEYWNSSAIQALNPGLPLPAAQIKLIGRGDSSGSTQIFTSYLSKYSTKFQKAVGATSLPKWPSSVILGNTASELIYVSSNIKYSLTYVPMEAVSQAKSLGQTPQITRLYNSLQELTMPDSLESVINAMQAAALKSPFSRHGYLDIFDIQEAHAYPIALMSFILIRENYFYFSPGSQYDCDRIKAMVNFWYFLFTDTYVINENLNQGWVSVSGDLLKDNLKRLALVTCNRKNIMDDLNTDFERKAFYAKRKKYYNWDYSIKFWDNPSKFTTSQVGSSITTTRATIVATPKAQSAPA
ncbi:hypothetical protein BDR26DRAFT_304727 [Obelidium mucronatum]|nr:hypothetical protein BDR26DRAFT_304727 [Obelidium mucronatum]